VKGRDKWRTYERIVVDRRRKEQRKEREATEGIEGVSKQNVR